MGRRLALNQLFPRYLLFNLILYLSNKFQAVSALNRKSSMAKMMEKYSILSNKIKVDFNSKEETPSKAPSQILKM